MRKLLSLLVLVGLLVVGDFWLKSTAEVRVAAEIQRTFDSKGDSKVDFSGFPFILKAVSGTIPSATVTSTSLESEGIRFSDVRMTMQDIEFSVGKILAGDMGSVKVRDGHGRASISGNRLAEALGSVADLEIDFQDGKLRVQAGPVEATAQLTLNANELVLEVPVIGRSFTLALPRFVDGLEYQSVRLSGSDVIVEFSLEDANFRQF